MTYALEQADIAATADDVVRELARAERPLLIFGAGGKHADALALMYTLDIPCVVTWGAKDYFDRHPLCFGTFGTHGLKGANLAVQNADYILCIGSRLDTKATGHPPSSFAPKARIVMVDVDWSELSKMEKLGRPLYRAVQAEGSDFLRHMMPRAREIREQRDERSDGTEPVGRWVLQLCDWRKGHLPGPGKPYEVMRELGALLRPSDTVVSDTGCVLAWAMQALPLPCRFIHAFNQTPMGYGLPAAVGAAFATGGRVILLTGDGGLSVNITEFATIKHHSLPVKVLLFNNRGHAMCRQTQRQWLGGKYHGTGDKDLATPSFRSIAAGYFIPLADSIAGLMTADGPAFCEIEVDPMQGVSPQIKYGEALA